MRKLTVDDVLPLDRYLAERDAHRAAVREARRRRRVPLGDRCSLHFENRQTVLFQIHEMARAENIRDPDKIAEEVAIYNDLVADDGELRATFFVEISDRSRIKEELDSLIGLERQGLYFVVDGERIPADFEPGHAREDRISSVHFVRFRLRPDQEQRLREQRARVAVEIDHPNYRARTELGPETLAALAADLGQAAVPA